MLTQDQIEGGWTELKGKIKSAWGQISDDELREFEGDVDQLVGLIQRQTGRARQEIENRLGELDERFSPMLSRAAETAREYAEKTSQAASDASEKIRQSVAAGHAQAEQMVQQRPLESVAVAFGTGLIAGIIVGLLVRSR